MALPRNCKFLQEKDKFGSGNIAEGYIWPAQSEKIAKLSEKSKSSFPSIDKMSHFF